MLAVLLVLNTILEDPAVAAARQAAIRLAREALAGELRVEPETLVVRKASAVEWADSSLGCPQKGERYLPVLLPGHRVELEHAGRTYVMHVGQGRAVHCEREATRSGREERQGAAVAARIVEEARRDLAQRLGVREDEIRIGWLRRMTWPDASLGCPRPGEAYAQAETRGFAIELEARGARYRYHGDGRRTIPCPTSPQP